MNQNHSDETPAPAPFLEIGDQYFNDSEAHALPSLDFCLTPEPPDEEQDATVEYHPEEQAYRVRGVGVSLDEQLARNHALGERAAVMVTHPGVGLVRVYFSDHEDAPVESLAGANPHDFMLLTAFVTGLAGLIGWPNTLRVLHPDTLAYILSGTLDRLRRRARHDANGPEAAAFRDVQNAVAEVTTRAAERFLEFAAAGHTFGSAKEHVRAKAAALTHLIG